MVTLKNTIKRTWNYTCLLLKRHFIFCQAIIIEIDFFLHIPNAFDENCKICQVNLVMQRFTLKLVIVVDRTLSMKHMLCNIY